MMKKFTLMAAVAALTFNTGNAQNIVASGINGSRTPITQSTSKPTVVDKGSTSMFSVTYTDNFDGDNSVTGLTARGYTSIFNGTGTVGTTDTWFQGNPVVFAAYNGPDTGYVAANYNTVGSGDIDNWLITPQMNVATGDLLTFYTQATLNSTYPDSIRVMYSATGAITATDPSWVELGRFKVNTTGAWLLSSYAAPSAGATATFAIRYCVIDGGPLGANSDFIGIDQLDVTGSCVSIAVGAPFTEGFETGGGTATAPILPLGWTEEDTDGDGNFWDMPATYPHNGTICARIGFGGGTAAATVENWIFSPCLDLSAGTNYVLEYWYKSFDGTLIPYSLESRIGTSASSAGMTIPVAIEANPTDSSYHFASHPFTVPANGTYFAGWNGFGTGVQVSMRFDDAAISVVTGVEENNLSNLVNIYPNPAAEVLNITCKMKGAVKVEMVNSIGQLVHTANYSEPFKVQVNTSSFSKGIYTVILTSENETLVKKVVLQNN